MRAGFENTLYIDLKNVGTVSSSSQLKMALNPLLSMLNTTPPADVISGDTLVCNYSNLPPLQTRKYRINVSMAVVPPGTQVLVRAEVLAGADADILNNVAYLMSKLFRPMIKRKKQTKKTKPIILKPTFCLSKLIKGNLPEHIRADDL